MRYLKDLSLTQLRAISDACFEEAVFEGKTDDSYSDNVNRHIIRAVHDEFGAAYLGNLRVPAGLPVLYPWCGERVASFSADFVVPTLDDQLADMLTTRSDTPAADRADDCSDCTAIIDRIRALGGCLLHWSCRERS